MADVLVLRQPSLGDDLDGVTAALTAAFAEIRAAVLAERPVILVLDDRDLLGQGGVVDAALATGMLGLVRAFALEGVKPGWRVNAVTHRGDPEASAVVETAAWVGDSGLSGQLLRVGTDHLGKVWP
jgi:hypothetical protein